MRIGALLLSVVLGAAPVAARADEAASTTPAAAPSVDKTARADSAQSLETVVVTAQKRVESLQRTPISIEVLDQKKLETLGIQGLNDLNSNVPSLNIEPFPTNNAELLIFIRGIGANDAQITQDPSVAVYVDGIYIARSAGLALDIADLARVEVLRGPQGTLYGRNATGGAINLITKRPLTNAVSSSVTVSIGTRGMLLGKGYISVPFSESFAAKLSILGKGANGFVHNDGPGGSFGDRDDRAARAELYWGPTDWFTARYAYDVSRLSDFNYMYQAEIPSLHTHGQADLFKAYAQSQTVYASHRLHTLATGVPLEASGTHVQGHAATFDLSLDPFVLKYLGSYRTLRDGTYDDLGGGAGSTTFRTDTGAYDGPSATLANGGPVALEIPTVSQVQVTHELDLSGKLLDDTVDFVAGAYYFIEEGQEDGRPLHHIVNTLIDPSQMAISPLIPPSLISTLAGVTQPGIAVYWNYLYQIHNTATALFGQSTWSPEFLDRRLHLTVGARQSWDKRQAVKNYTALEYLEFQRNGVGAAVPLPAMQGNDTFNGVYASKDYRNFSPSFNIQYDLTPRAAAYLSSSKAYKSGGYNVRDPQISRASGPASDGTNYGLGFVDGFRPELVHSYEAGIKSEWFGRRLRVNGDIFTTGYHDEQVNFLIAGTIGDTKTLNAGRARINGFELDTTYLVFPGLIWTTSYAWLQAKTLDVRDINGNNVADRFPFPSAPRNSGNTSLDWTFLKSGWGNLRAYLNYSYTGDRLGSHSLTTYSEGGALPGYGLVNAQLGANSIRLGGNNLLDVNVWAHNLLDKEYVVSAIDALPQADRAVIWGEPRSFGMNLVYRYH